ncbi:hypothetical protein K2173_004647 [Erythroxylum novogranatense]|uniref:Uncharacterized protein n=1 Tax=Erythroxylum novogranatense TaxID=1862640 RepID=A0AAV8SZ67_9ROSI|nr:hypothetical protein K2173_004647 [Erythroxylum novogranatense]
METSQQERKFIAVVKSSLQILVSFLIFCMFLYLPIPSTSRFFTGLFWLLSQTLERKHTFLICAGILAFLSWESSSVSCFPSSSSSSDDLDQFSDIETTEADGDEEEECGHEALECLENDFVDDNETEENQETSLLTSPPPPPLLPEEKEEITFGIGLKGEVFTEEQIGFIVKKEEGDYGGEAAPSMEADQELANTEELNRRVEEFIREVIEEFVREVKEEIRIEAQQPLIAF